MQRMWLLDQLFYPAFFFHSPKKFGSFLEGQFVDKLPTVFEVVRFGTLLPFSKTTAKLCGFDMVAENFTVDDH
jgi:hypothetical protein